MRIPPPDNAGDAARSRRAYTAVEARALSEAREQAMLTERVLTEEHARLAREPHDALGELDRLLRVLRPVADGAGRGGTGPVTAGLGSSTGPAGPGEEALMSTRPARRGGRDRRGAQEPRPGLVSRS